MLVSNFSGEEDSKNNISRVPIINANNTEIHDIHPYAPVIKNVQDEKNTCVLGSLDQALFATNEHILEHAVL